MKLTIFSIATLALVLVSCQQPANKVYSPQKTEPMELTRFEAIQLLKPDTTSGDALMKTFLHRKSNRDFTEGNLSLKHLSEILWAAYGINREDGKRTVPSAMALYPLKVYAVLANGIYLYDPEKSELQPVVEGDYRALAGLQPAIDKAPLNLIFIADYTKYSSMENFPREKWQPLVSLDAGHCTQNVYLYCASEGLKVVVRAGAQEEKLFELLGLGDNYQFIVAQTVGY